MSPLTAAQLEAAFQPPPVLLDPGPEYAPDRRRWQGIPAIERSAGGRLWAAWYSGGDGECPENYVQVVVSDDDGHQWSAPWLVVDPPGRVRAFDPALWHDPQGRLWLFWAQSAEWFDGRAGVWAIRCDRPDQEPRAWTAPRRLCHGIMMNKPTVLSTGEWLLPAAVWTGRDSALPGLASFRFSNVVCSTDAGATWVLRGSADVPGRSCDEHLIVERRDGTLWMLVRTTYGVGESTSTDRGATWSPGWPSGIAGPNSRFCISRLRSGRLLLVNHYQFTGRSNLTALLSEDDGESWREGLVLDARADVSYPDAVEAPDGRLYIIYDHGRYQEKEILLAVCREADILAGRCHTPGTRLQQVVNRVG